MARSALRSGEDSELDRKPKGEGPDSRADRALGVRSSSSSLAGGRSLRAALVNPLKDSSQEHPVFSGRALDCVA